VNAPARLLEWTEANQQRLVAEFNRIKCLLREEDVSPAQGEIDGLRRATAAPAAIDRIVERFGLSPFERDTLLLAAGVEMDAEIGELCALASAAKRPYASFGLALAALPGAHWSACTPGRPLRRWRLVETTDDRALIAARVLIDERILHYLAGINEVDARLRSFLRPVAAPQSLAAGHERCRDLLVEALAGESGSMVVQLCGNDADGKRDVASAAAALLGMPLHALRIEDLPLDVHELEAFSVLWGRESILLDGALLVETADDTVAAVRKFVERTDGVLLLAVREPIVSDGPDRTLRIDKPSRREQLELWRRALGERTAELPLGSLESLAAEFTLSARDIECAARTVEGSPVSETPGRLATACRRYSSRRLGVLAQRIEPLATWEDLVLPDPQLQLLQRIVAHLRHRLTVFEHWGFASKCGRGHGLSALFAGESGTGKTMAAEVLANALHLELYRIDLAAVVSKYIGETEKNLGRVFDAAEESGAILLFDEADALFGKRSEVKDSHDRYANVEVSYLLQRMETYRGLAILTSNQKAALDSAFQRRLRFVVHFPFPDARERERIWRRVFPAALPTDLLDPARLARLHVSGGAIRNIALNAAFDAARAGEPVGMHHIRDAAYAEAAKQERVLTEAETRGWV
jgi:hypothetical protein